MHVRGTCHVLFAFDVGFEAHLVEAERWLAKPAPRRGLAHKLRVGPEALGERAPLRFAQECESIALDGHRTTGPVEFALYDFGGLCVTFSLPFDTELHGLVPISAQLWESAELLAAARRAAGAALASLGRSVREAHLADVVEDYVIFQVRASDGSVDELCTEHRGTVARVLRAEERELSAHEIEDALRARIGYLPGEIALVDWFGALLFGGDMEDERRVLELAHMEILALRFLESRLDRWIHEAYGLLARARRPLPPFSPHAHELARIARMQADSAMLHDGIDNAVKLLGDEYLARLYRIAAERFHVSGWDASLERKMHNLDSIYQKLSDLAGRRRAELLEWIIIALIGFDIAVHLL